MGTFSLITPTLWVHDTDLTAVSHKVTLQTAAQDLDVSTFGTTYRQRIGGLRQVSAAVDGYWSSTPDSAKFAAVGVANRCATISPQGTEGGTAYLFQAGDFKYDQFGPVGQAAPFAVAMSGSNSVGMIRGQLASASRTISATGQIGSILTLAGPTANQYLYASFHVFTAATTITVIVESATLIGFGSPTTRATIGPITVAGGTFMTRVAGPITDGFWRLNASAITGTVVVGGAIGVQ